MMFRATTPFDCRQIVSACHGRYLYWLYYKTTQSLVMDVIGAHFLFAATIQLALRQGDRNVGDQNTVINGIKLFDERKL
jgi:hypothetical protein